MINLPDQHLACDIIELGSLDLIKAWAHTNSAMIMWNPIKLRYQIWVPEQSFLEFNNLFGSSVVVL